MRKRLFGETVALIGGAIATSVAVVGASCHGLFAAGMMTPDAGERPSTSVFAVLAFLIGGGCSIVPIGLLSGVVFAILPIFGFRMDTTARGFEMMIFIFWAIGISTSAICAALMMVFVKGHKGAVPDDNVLFRMAIGAGVITLAIDGILIRRRYRKLKEWIVRFEASQQDAILNKNS